MSDLGELDTRGYTVIRGFLSEPDLAYFVEDYRARPLSDNDSYPVRTLSAAALARVRSEGSPFIALSEHVANASTVQCNLVVESLYFGIRDGVNFSWHQDHESYYLYQDHRDYLNFFIPIIKPERARTNLRVISFAKLATHAPALADELRHRGGTTLYPRGDAVLVLDGCEGGVLGSLPGATIDAVAETPELGAGDLLLMRGDVLHRTQDSATHRVALSVRMANADSVVDGRKLRSGGLTKLLIMTGNRADFHPRTRALASARRQRLTVGELEQRATEPYGALPTDRDFARELLIYRDAAELARLEAEIAALRRDAGDSKAALGQLARVDALQLDALLRELRSSNR